jgi:hypothetical protein
MTRRDDAEDKSGFLDQGGAQRVRDVLMAIVNRLGSRVEVKVKLYRRQRVDHQVPA